MNSHEFAADTIVSTIKVTLCAAGRRLRLAVTGPGRDIGPSSCALVGFHCTHMPGTAAVTPGGITPVGA